MTPTLIALALLSGTPEPDPSLGPDRVVQIQVDALRAVDKPARDAGIATTFRFASPGNREATGPLARFTAIVKAPEYRPLLGHRIAGYDPIAIEGDAAAQRVRVIAADGRAYDYEFRLSKDPRSACWFTDGVIPLNRPAPKPAGPIT